MKKKGERGGGEQGPKESKGEGDPFQRPWRDHYKKAVSEIPSFNASIRGIKGKRG